MDTNFVRKLSFVLGTLNLLMRRPSKDKLKRQFVAS